MGNTIMKWVPIFGLDQYEYDMTADEQDEKLQAKDDQILRDCKDVDLVNLINFLEKQGVDVKSLKCMIADILQKHQTTQFHPVFQALQTALKSQGQFDDMIKAITALVDENKIAIIKRTKSNHGSQQKEFYANVEAMSNLVTNVLSAAGAGPVGPILVSLLQSIKKVNFFTSACKTEGHKDETLGIIDIVWDDERNGTVLFEIAKVEVKMVDQQGEVVFVGSSKVMVNIDMYYARASMELQDFMTPEQLKKLKANTKGNFIL